MTPILHPVPMSAAALLALNDHVLKHAGVLPGWFTGKFSDVLGLFFFPMLLVSLLHITGSVRSEPRAQLIAVWSTGLLFTLLNVWSWPAQVLSPWFFVTPDLTDLLTLPMLGVSLWWMRRDAPTLPIRSSLRVLGLAAVALASMATSAMPPPMILSARDYPIWRLSQPIAQQLDPCVTARAWISKSGRQGVGITLRLDHLCDDERQVPVQRVAMTLSSHRTFAVPKDKLPTLLLGPKSTQHAYLPIPFDNLAAWEQGAHAGVLEISVGSDPKTLRAPMTYKLRGLYRSYPNSNAPSRVRCVPPRCTPRSGVRKTQGESRAYMR